MLPWQCRAPGTRSKENRVLALEHDTSRNEADVGDNNVEDLCLMADAEQGMPGGDEMRSSRGLKREEQQG
jgi:hypothetical protein